MSTELSVKRIRN